MISIFRKLTLTKLNSVFTLSLRCFILNKNYSLDNVNFAV